ncbi:hypothetical protein [Altericroceibacterium endophyticum]|uniref:hypothetical protein n=1 Tax=Altericroceibacterium endophyticum TaxID=1808508 RepID=UPI0013689A7E|nr:hypothetical protein [Altericroceibacterium endophyticum]
MEINNMAARKRPTLSLSFGGKSRASRSSSAAAQTLLSGSELRRVVADMVD